MVEGIVEILLNVRKTWEGRARVLIRQQLRIRRNVMHVHNLVTLARKF